MSDENISAAAAIRSLCKTIQTRLEQNEDFRALRALERALVEVTQTKLPAARQLQATLTEALSRDASAVPPATPAKETELGTARGSGATPSSLLSGDGLRFG